MKKFTLFLTPLMGISFLASCGGTKYTVTFNTGKGGSVVPSQKVEPNKRAVKPTDPTREGPDEDHGYVFNEWQLDGIKFDFDTPITKNITLKAN